MALHFCLLFIVCFLRSSFKILSRTACRTDRVEGLGKSIENVSVTLSYSTYRGMKKELSGTIYSGLDKIHSFGLI
jgi:hypothetical protein